MVVAIQYSRHWSSITALRKPHTAKYTVYRKRRNFRGHNIRGLNFREDKFSWVYAPLFGIDVDGLRSFDNQI